jgi:hypothetical protein
MTIIGGLKSTQPPKPTLPCVEAKPVEAKQEVEVARTRADATNDKHAAQTIGAEKQNGQPLVGESRSRMGSGYWATF